jgi:RNA polymerase sigma-70 factor (ECF subfamily)
MTMRIGQISQSADCDLLAVKRAQAGDLGAFEELVLKYEKRIYAIAYHMLSDREESQDATQEAFLKAFRALPSFEGNAKFSTWLHRIAANTCVDMLRKRKSINALSLDSYTENEDGAYDSFAIPDSADIEADVENAEFRALVLKAVAMLPDAHRAIIVMRDFQDMEYAQIAAALGCPEGTVKSRISRARASLRRILLNERELKGYINVNSSKEQID